MDPTSGAVGAISSTVGATGAGSGAASTSSSGSGSATLEIVRFGASRGMVASSPTVGSPLVSSRSVGGGAVDFVKEMVDDAV